MTNAEEWILREDLVANQDRITRLQWLLDQTQQNEIWLFHGGFLNHELFEQARYSFIYGQFLATIILGLSFIEQTLAALLFASGRDDLERANLTQLIEEAYKNGWVDDQGIKAINQARKIRNDVTHYRNPSNKDSLVHQTKMEPDKVESFLEQKARQMMLTVFYTLSQFSTR